MTSVAAAVRTPQHQLSCWLQVMSHLSPRFGGIAASVPPLARATKEQGTVDCPIVGFCIPEEIDDIKPEEQNSVKTFAPERRQWITDLGLRRDLKQRIQAASGIHIHGIWETHCATSAGIARRCAKPYIISAHGMLEPWALRQKRLKKALYAALFESRVLQGASCLRALTRDESQDYRRVGLRNPIAIVPSGIEVPHNADPEKFRDRFPELAGKRIVAFLGRLHYKKGLHLLLRAWAKAERSKDAHLVIAGPDSEGTLAALTQQRDESNLRDSVTFTGMMEGDLKWSFLAAASLFALPSYSEGFSVAVLEALGMGLPVVVTEGCHIPEIATQGCGWVVPTGAEPLRRALQEFFELSPQEARQAGDCGRDLIEARYRWPIVGKQMADVYDWLEGGNKPQGVEIV